MHALRCKAGGSNGPLAQSVEQKTFNLLVDGSNPSRPTNAFNDLGGRKVAFFMRSVIRSVKPSVGASPYAMIRDHREG